MLSFAVNVMLDTNVPTRILKAFDELWADLKIRNANRDSPEWDRMPVFLMDKGELMARVLGSADIVTLDELQATSLSRLQQILAARDPSIALSQLREEANKLSTGDSRFEHWQQAVALV